MSFNCSLNSNHSYCLPRKPFLSNTPSLFIISDIYKKDRYRNWGGLNDMMIKLWRWYQKCLEIHPVKTQVISSAFIWGFGDIAAQTITHHSTLRSQQQHLSSSVCPFLPHLYMCLSIHMRFIFSIFCFCLVSKWRALSVGLFYVHLTAPIYAFSVSLNPNLFVLMFFAVAFYTCIKNMIK